MAEEPFAEINSIPSGQEARVKTGVATRQRGLFEREPWVWWIHWYEAEGRRHREEAGSKSNAINLYRKRKSEALAGKKLPEKLRGRVVRFSELAEDAESYCQANNQGQEFDCYRIGRFKEEFGNGPAEIPVEDFRRWFNEQVWKEATHNRYKTMLSLIYRLGMEHGKVKSNPARLLKRKREDNGRVRFLNQFAPAKTELEHLQGLEDEESRLRAVIVHRYPDHLPEFEIATNTGMRPREQYSLSWDRVDLQRRMVTIPNSKNWKTRHVSLNAEAAAAFATLFERRVQGAAPVFVNMEGVPLHGYQHWFDGAAGNAGIRKSPGTPAPPPCQPVGDGGGGVVNGGRADRTPDDSNDDAICATDAGAPAGGRRAVAARIRLSRYLIVRCRDVGA